MIQTLKLWIDNEDELKFDEIMTDDGKWDTYKRTPTNEIIKQINYLADGYDYFIGENKQSKEHFLYRNKK